jgi:hypothetical protein
MNLSFLLQIFASPSDPVLGYGVQTLGACFLGVAIFQYLCLESRDDTVIGSIVLSKALVNYQNRGATINTGIVYHSILMPRFNFLYTILLIRILVNRANW